MMRFPDDGLTVVCLSNRGNGHADNFAMKVADVLLPAPAEARDGRSSRGLEGQAQSGSAVAQLGEALSATPRVSDFLLASVKGETPSTRHVR